MNGKNGQNGQNGEDGGYGPQGPTGPYGVPQGIIGPSVFGKHHQALQDCTERSGTSRVHGLRQGCRERSEVSATDLRQIQYTQIVPVCHIQHL